MLNSFSRSRTLSMKSFRLWFDVGDAIWFELLLSEVASIGEYRKELLFEDWRFNFEFMFELFNGLYMEFWFMLLVLLLLLSSFVSVMFWNLKLLLGLLNARIGTFAKLQKWRAQQGYIYILLLLEMQPILHGVYILITYIN